MPGPNRRGFIASVRVMQEARVDILLCFQGSKDVPLHRLDRVIMLCREPAETFPVLPDKIQLMPWPMRDPTATRDDEEVVLQAFGQAMTFAIASKILF